MNDRRGFLLHSAMAALAFTPAARTLGAELQGSPTADPALLQRATALLDQAPLIDTHNDLPSAILEVSAGEPTLFDLALRQWKKWPSNCSAPSPR